MDNIVRDSNIIAVAAQGSKEKSQVRVFVSYDSEDEEVATKIALALRVGSADRLSLFVAGAVGKVDHIRPGEEWRQSITSNMATCRAVLCLATEGSLARPWVNYELGVADAQEKQVFGFQLDPNVKGLTTHPIANRQFARAEVESWMEAVRNLVEHINRSLKRMKKPPVEIKEKHVRACFESIFAERKQRNAIINEINANEDRHLKHMGCSIHEQSRVAIRHLDEAEKLSETKYIRRFHEAISGLKKNDVLLAICGDKNWARGDVLEYMDHMSEVAKNGVAVRRIYIEPTTGFKQDELRLIKSHFQWQDTGGLDFEICVLMGDQAREVREKYKLLDGFGMVLPIAAKGVPMAMIHFGLMDGFRQARFFTNEHIRAAYVDMHEDIWQKRTPDSVVRQYLEDRGVEPHRKIRAPST